MYEYDAGFDRATPALVAAPGTAAETAAVVAACARAEVPLVARGAGTGLAGGAIAPGGVVVSTARLRRILEIDTESRAALVEPGVVNLALADALAPHGLLFGPDPASQRCSTIGGNIGNNAGGPHALRYGSVVQHVLGLELILADGTPCAMGGRAPDRAGYDPTPFVVGAEGTVGIVTKAWLRLLPRPEAVRTFLAFFADVESGAEAATAIIAEGIIPAALEMMDAPTIRAVNAAFEAHLPADAGSLLLVELEGPAEECEARHERIVAICRRGGATDIKAAANEEERALLWKARKLGYPALARLAPNNYLMDGVVPRTKLPETLRQVAVIAERYGLLVANMFHIGDGNLHPTLLFDAAVPGTTEKAIEASALILKHCVEVGGALSGEHGIGVEKNQFMRWVFSDADLDTMHRVRDAFDPSGRMNPGKIFPTDEPPRELPLERLKFRFAEDMWV
ncbi:MAG: FAD-binding protein [Chloroflexi bacterium]|nr:MAG: FAD-binding protein [Chloroflexota bacterium]